MEITEERKQKLEEIYQQFLHDERILRMEKIPMHRGCNCYVHSFRVARLAIKNALRHKEVLLEVVLLAAILHDYYLYDWRKDRAYRKKHSRNHPYVASKQAEEDFHISKLIKDAIESHMWPINFSKFPETKEARIVSVADKMMATREALCSKAHKAKRMEKYYKEIQTLF